MPLNPKYLPLLLFLDSTGAFAEAGSYEKSFDISRLSLQELMKIKVTTASKREQSQQETPAFVEIITQNDLQHRGYKDLSYLLDDLAGVQVSRSFGDNTFSVLWRGIRHTIGSSHLILVDGVRFNHLYNNEAEVLAAIPMSNIKQIEIVYGPASAAYGSDAVVGIINIISEKDAQHSNGFIQIGDNGQRVLDASWSTQLEDYHVSFTARIDNGNVDFSNASEYRWTNPALLDNPDIWGGFSETYGALSSPHKNRGFDARLSNQNHQFVVQFYRMAGGYGLEYTFDHSLPDAGIWSESDYSAYWQSNITLNDHTSLKSLLRYRQSDIDNDSLFIESYLATDPDTGEPVRLADASYWEAKDSSVSGLIEVDWSVSSRWHLLSGLEFENKDLQKAYNINFGPSLPPSQIDLQTYPFPSPPTKDTVNNNRINTEQQSLYGLAEYELPSSDNSMHHSLHLGVRYDKHSEFGGETSIRTGYVGQWPNFTLKLLYGEAFQEPPPRLLYGGWQGSGSDPDLMPRTAKTWELNASYQLTNALMSASYYAMQSRNLFNTTDVGAINAGNGRVFGGDLRYQYRDKTAALNDYSFWAALSWVDTREQAFDQSNELLWSNVGDLADITLHLGSDIQLNSNWRLNLRGRYYGDRPVVNTNPIGKVDSFSSFDINLIYAPTRWKNLKFGFAVTNIADSTYFHPGVRSASASTTNPGALNSNGVWIGSESFYNAQIPQPGRQGQLTLYWDF